MPRTQSLKSAAAMSESQSDLLDNERNVQFFSSLTGDLLGGLVQNSSDTQANFTDMPDIVLVVVSPLIVKTSSLQTISRTSHPLTPGDYNIYVSSGGRSSNVQRNGKKRLSIEISGELLVLQLLPTVVVVASEVLRMVCGPGMESMSSVELLTIALVWTNGRALRPLTYSPLIIC